MRDPVSFAYRLDKASKGASTVYSTASNTGNVVRIFLTGLISLCLTFFAHAEYSRHLDSYLLKIASVGELDIAYRIVEPGPDKPKVAVIMGLGGSNMAWGGTLISG